MDDSHQSFPQRRLGLLRLFASHAHGSRRDRLQPGLRDGHSTLLTSTVLFRPQLKERSIDRLDLGFRSPIQTIEQSNHRLLLPSLLHFTFDIALEPAQIFFRLGHFPKQLTPLRDQLLSNIVDSYHCSTLPHDGRSATTFAHLLFHALFPCRERGFNICAFLSHEMLAMLDELIKGGSRLLRLL
jgi:hypothetical protein